MIVKVSDKHNLLPAKTRRNLKRKQTHLQVHYLYNQTQTRKALQAKTLLMYGEKSSDVRKTVIPQD